jgi:hypothetical protein
MTILLALLAGFVMAAVFLTWARRKRPDHARRLYALGLLIAALIYVAFALAGHGSARWVALELIGVLLYGGAAWIGLRTAPLVLALGWAAHVGWDVLLHVRGDGAAYTPDWYPWFCVSFDLIVAGATLMRRGHESESASRSAA